MLPARANARKCLRSSHAKVRMKTVCNFADGLRNPSTSAACISSAGSRHALLTAQVNTRRDPMNAAPDQVMDLMFGRWRSQIFSAGTELGVFDRLDKSRAKTAQTLSTELNVDPTLLYRL